MKAILTAQALTLALVASGVAIQVPSHIVYLSVEHSSASSRITNNAAAGSYGDLPLSFEVNRGQVDSRVKFLSRGRGYNLYLTAKEAVMALHASGSASPENVNRRSTATNVQSSLLRMNFVGASDTTDIVASDELPGKSNYFIGRDAKKWRLNVPAYSRATYKGAYPGVDIMFYGQGGRLEYDFIVAPGASFKPVRISFEGARRVSVNESGDLIIETPAGEVRQRKPSIYQQSGDKRLEVKGGYVIAGEMEVAFEVGAYDRTLALVIDPVLVYSTSVGGIYNDNANAIAVDAQGNAYIAGTTNSTDFLTVNPFQANLKIGVVVGIPSDAFVTKLNPSGTAVLYSTYLGGGINDGANGIAVDPSGSAYVTGYAVSSDFPTTSGAFLTKAIAAGAAFITKLNPAGNGLVYSTYLGGDVPPFSVSDVGSAGRGIAVDADGNAYVAGYTYSESFPLKKPAQSVFNRGFTSCCDCRRFSLASVREDIFVTKLDPSGSALVYSTYLGGSNVDEAYAIAVDSTGSAYVTGATCSFDFPNATLAGLEDAFLLKLNPTGKKFVYTTSFGGRGFDFANGIAVDSEGNAYITGQTDSDDFPITSSAFQPRFGGSVLYATTDGGRDWRSVSGFINSSTTALAIDPSNHLRMFGGLRFTYPGNGLQISTDGGDTWHNPTIITNGSPSMLAIDPKNPNVLYTAGSKSTDGGMSWKAMGFPANSFQFGPARLLINPMNTSTMLLLFLGGSGGDVVFPSQFFKTTDGGSNWDYVRNGTQRLGPSAAALDPQNPSTVYVIQSNLFKSTDAGNTWRVPYEGNRSFERLAIDPANGLTVYLTDLTGNIYKTTDGGSTFSSLGRVSTPVNEFLVDPKNSSMLYAGTGAPGQNGAVLKSTDGGLTWNASLVARAVNVLVIDPIDSSRLFAGVDYDVDSFVLKVNPTGHALVYSTYLGSRSLDTTSAIAIDGAGNAYVTGKTFSDRFPAKDALIAAKPAGPFDTSTFATKLNASGSSVLFSTYLGNNEPGFGSAVAVDRAGKIYVAGTTGSPAFVPSARLPESAHGGFDAFVVKIASPPRITSAAISGKNLIVTGEGFDLGAVILLLSVEQRTKNDQANPTTVLIGKKSANTIPPGVNTGIRVRNTDGLVSEPFFFTR